MHYSMDGEVSSITPLTLDTTLTLEGASAEAKATGAAIQAAKDDIQKNLQNHENNRENPHNVTAEQVGLGSCDNTSDADKPVSTKQAEAIAAAKASGDAAQRTANEAKNIAQNALPKAGGEMTGDINMGTHRITGVAAPEDDTDATNKKFVVGHVEEYVTKKIGESTDGKHLFFSAFLNSSGWAGNSAPYTQTVDVEGILETDRPHISPIYADDFSTKKLERAAWMRVCEADTSDGSVTFTCFDEKPTFGINLQIEVNRA